MWHATQAVAGCSSASDPAAYHGCSVTGVTCTAAVSEIKGLAGWHLLGDWCTGAVFGIPSDVTALTPPRTLLLTDAAITAFGEHAAGEMYLADRRGGIYRIVAGG